MKAHALLSASGASRWLICTPSARFEEQCAEQESSYADEGTLAHELAVHLIIYYAYGINVDRELKKIQENELYDASMLDYITEYAKWVVQKVRDAPEGAILLQEQRLNLHEYVPEGFGTSDVDIVGGNMLEVIDLKYGKGVVVDAFENKQMMLYALGVWEEVNLLYNIEYVRMTIYQPRIDNISSYDMAIEDLLKWVREVLIPTAKEAFKGTGEFVPGDHCRFCRARSICKATAQWNLQLAAREFDPASLTDEQMVKILLRAKSIKNWITSIENYAMTLAIRDGKKWPGMKVVQGRSVRKITDEQAVILALERAGVDVEGEKIVNKKLSGITQLTKILTTLQFQQNVEPHLFKPPGKPTLVSITDKRPEYNRDEAAALDFKTEDDET